LIADWQNVAVLKNDVCKELRAKRRQCIQKWLHAKV